MMPMGNWTVISKNPFRFLIAMEAGNHSLILLKKYKEAALHFMPWSERERVIRAGYLSGRDVNKAKRLRFGLKPAEALQHTKLVVGADNVFEMVVLQGLKGLSREFVPYVMDVVAVHGDKHMVDRKPILFLSDKDFATLGENWRYHS
jgi:flavin reductase (DIM6/NTAB) family NADH-FMN oxidoreductase RutF